MNAVERAAHDYLARGWSVVPLRPAEKRPLLPWQEFQVRRAQRDDVAAWFRRWPEADVGIVTGLLSRLLVLDVDPRHGGDASLARLGSLPATIEAATGGGGRHLYFAHPGGLVRNRVGLAPGVDLRGDGGYVVAPPSRHASGRRYVWSRAPGEADPAPAPEWLLREATGPRRRGHPVSHWRRVVHEGVAEGARNNTIASLAGHLLAHDVDPEVLTELLICWNAVRCQPPLPLAEVVRTVESITHLHEHGDA
ncbi:MAG: bifunctional DNA primase/polymerase [Planctomycetota bacterium]